MLSRLQEVVRTTFCTLLCGAGVAANDSAAVVGNGGEAAAVRAALHKLHAAPAMTQEGLDEKFEAIRTARMVGGILSPAEYVTAIIGAESYEALLSFARYLQYGSFACLAFLVVGAFVYLHSVAKQRQAHEVQIDAQRVKEQEAHRLERRASLGMGYRRRPVSLDTCTCRRRSIDVGMPCDPSSAPRWPLLRHLSKLVVVQGKGDLAPK